jgi:hypothetical protein
MTAPKPTIGGPTKDAWREKTLARAEALSFLRHWIRSQAGAKEADACDASIEAHLRAARDAATHTSWGRGLGLRQGAGTGQGADLRHDAAPRPSAGSGQGAGSEPEADGSAGRFTRWGRSGSPFERALANLDMAEVDLLRLADSSVLEGALPSIQAHVNRFLPKDDPRRIALDKVIKAKSSNPQFALDAVPREHVLCAMFAANTQRIRNLMRLGSFLRMLRVGAAVGCVLAIALAAVGAAWPQAMPLCFTPEGGGNVTLACPQGTVELGEYSQVTPKQVERETAATVKPGDVLLVQFLGLLGAALSVMALFRSVRRGTSTPYNVALWLAILKLPTGALTAVAGLMLLRADFVPGLSALDTPAQILGWALVFGIAQQLVTQIADNRAHGLIEDVGGRGAAGDRPLSTSARR